MTTNKPQPITILVCSECGQGNYYRQSSDSPWWNCDKCDHYILPEHDLDLDPGEFPAVSAEGALGYFSEDIDDDARLVEEHNSYVEDMNDLDDTTD